MSRGTGEKVKEREVVGKQITMYILLYMALQKFERP